MRMGDGSCGWRWKLVVGNVVSYSLQNICRAGVTISYILPNICWVGMSSSHIRQNICPEYLPKPVSNILSRPTVMQQSGLASCRKRGLPGWSWAPLTQLPVVGQIQGANNGRVQNLPVAHVVGAKRRMLVG